MDIATVLLEEFVDRPPMAFRYAEELVQIVMGEIAVEHTASLEHLLSLVEAYYGVAYKPKIDRFASSYTGCESYDSWLKVYRAHRRSTVHDIAVAERDRILYFRKLYRYISYRPDPAYSSRLDVDMDFMYNVVFIRSILLNDISFSSLFKFMVCMGDDPIYKGFMAVGVACPVLLRRMVVLRNGLLDSGLHLGRARLIRSVERAICYLYRHDMSHLYSGDLVVEYARVAEPELATSYRIYGCLYDAVRRIGAGKVSSIAKLLRENMDIAVKGCRAAYSNYMTIKNLYGMKMLPCDKLVFSTIYTLSVGAHIHIYGKKAPFHTYAWFPQEDGEMRCYICCGYVGKFDYVISCSKCTASIAHVKCGTALNKCGYCGMHM